MVRVLHISYITALFLALLPSFALASPENPFILTPQPRPTFTATPSPAPTPRSRDNHSPTPKPSASRKPSPAPTAELRVACPSVIADTRTGVVEYNPKRKTFPYACYASVADAKTSGFDTLRAAEARDMSGWYRLSLKLTADTCDANPITTGPVLFLQIKQTASGVFGSFCPTAGDFSGMRGGNGFVMSTAREFSEEPSTSVCADGKVKEVQFVQMDRAVQGSAAYSVSLKMVRSCTSPESGAATCIREYSGAAFLETHTIWPKVSENILEMTPNCGDALKTCASCHSSLKDLPPPAP